MLNKPKADEQSKQLMFSEKQYQLLIEYIQSSFQKNNNKYIAIKHRGYPILIGFTQESAPTQYLKHTMFGQEWIKNFRDKGRNMDSF